MRSRARRWGISLLSLATAIAIGVIVVYGGARILHHSSPDRSAAAAAASGAESCTASGYAIVSRLTNAKRQIYDCEFRYGPKCVTYEDGVASDSTPEVRLLFSSVLGSSKPLCLG